MIIKWKEISLDKLFYIDQVLKIYNSAFPLEVREPDNLFIKGLKYAVDNKPNNYRILLGLDQDQVVSFATGHYLAKVNTGFIVYIATNPTYRNRGLGSRTLKKIEELLNSDALAAGYTSIHSYVLETETIETGHSLIEKEDCYKRELFFEKNHYQKANSIFYLQPPLHEGETEVPLNLFIKNLKEITMSKDDLINIIKAMYKEKYYLVNGIDLETLNFCLEKMCIGPQCMN